MKTNLSELLPELQPAQEDADAPAPIPVPDHPVFLGAGERWPILMIDKHRARLWGVLNEDFEVEPLSDLGHLTQFDHHLAFYLECGNLDELVDKAHSYSQVAGYPVGFGSEQWAMENGLVPGQAFLLEVCVRFYTHSGPEGVESDCETKFTIIEKQLCSTAEVVRVWEQWIQNHQAWVECVKRETASAQKALLQHPELLVITEDWFWPDYYDDCAPPSGLRLTLQSQMQAVRKDGTPAFSCSTYFTSGESRRGRFEEALADLEKNVQKRFPELAGVDLAKLKRFSYLPRRVPVCIEG